MDIPVGRLLVVDWIPQHGVWSDALIFVFDGGVLASGQAKFTLPADELSAARFVPLDEAAGQLRPSAVRRLRSSQHALDSGDCPLYLEFGRQTPSG